MNPRRPTNKLHQCITHCLQKLSARIHCNASSKALLISKLLENDCRQEGELKLIKLILLLMDLKLNL